MKKEREGDSDKGTGRDSEGEEGTRGQTKRGATTKRTSGIDRCYT